MQKFTIFLVAIILMIVVDCQRLERQVGFPNDESDSESDEKTNERGNWGPHFRRTRRPRTGRPTRPSPSTTTTVNENLNEIPQHIQGKKKNIK